MALLNKTQYGEINVSNDALASVIGEAALECYGVAGLSPKSSARTKVYEILGKGNYQKAVFVSQEKNITSIDLYLVISYGVKITEVLLEVQKRVKYIVEKSFGLNVKKVNVYAQNLKTIIE